MVVGRVVSTMVALGAVWECFEVFLALGPPRSMRKSIAVTRERQPKTAALSISRWGTESRDAKAKAPRRNQIVIFIYVL